MNLYIYYWNKLMFKFFYIEIPKFWILEYIKIFRLSLLEAENRKLDNCIYEFINILARKCNGFWQIILTKFIHLLNSDFLEVLLSAS